MHDLDDLRTTAALPADPRPGTKPLADSTLGQLGIELVHADAARIVLRMPGATAARIGAMHVLTESVASTAAGIAVGPARRAFGTELNAATLAQPDAHGPVVAEGTVVRSDAQMQVWRIRVIDANDTLVMESRCTLSIVDAPTS